MVVNFFRSSNPPASTVSVVPAQNLASTGQGGHSLDRRVRVTACLLGRGWWSFGSSGVSSGRLLKRDVLGGGACFTRAVARDGILRRRFCSGFCFWVFFLFSFFFFVHSLPL
jgi:hypothetical protein